MQTIRAVAFVASLMCPAGMDSSRTRERPFASRVGTSACSFTTYPEGVEVLRNHISYQRNVTSRNIGVVLVVICVWLMVVPGHSRADSDTARIGYLCEGYLSNRAAFENFVCRFHYVEGSASSVDAAVNGKLTSPQPIEGVWVVAGENVKYSLICDSETIEKTIQEAKRR